MENYKKLLEKARKAYKNCVTGAEKRRLESIFPELKESEDEDKIMKELIYNIIVSNDNTPSSKEIFSIYGKTKEDAIAWLEKQGEQSQYWKPSKEQLDALDYAYNLCPDTERGDYYEGVLKTIIDDLHKLSEKQSEQKETLCDKCRKTQPSHSCQDITSLGRCALEKQGEQNHNDDKNETVSKLIAIAECLEMDGDCSFNGYSGNECGKFLRKLSKTLWIEKQGEHTYWKPSEEQLQTLHAQLNEGAVTYPEDKRILFTLYEDLMKIMTQEEKQGEQNPAWSEENSCYYDDICEILINLINSPKSKINKDAIQKDLDWLMSIEKSQLKPAWSEEDKEQLDRAIYMMEQLDMTKSWDDVYNWIKSLKDRVQPKQ